MVFIKGEDYAMVQVLNIKTNPKFDIVNIQNDEYKKWNY